MKTHERSFLECFERISSPPPVPPTISPLTSVTFDGGGFRTLTHCGAVQVLRPYVTTNTRYYGDSMGAFYAVAAALFLHLPDGKMNRFLTDMLDYVYDVQQSWTATWGQCGNRCRQVLEEHLPDDIDLVQDRCFISVTCLSTDYGRVVSRFRDRSDLLDTVMASMFIPGWTDGFRTWVYSWRGHYTLDGGLSTHSPQPRGSRVGHYTVCSSISWRYLFYPPGDTIQDLFDAIESGSTLARRTLANGFHRSRL